MSMYRKFCSHLFTVLLIPKLITANAFLTDRLFMTELEAVIAAMNHYNPVSLDEKREYMGRVYRDDDSFRISVNAGQKNSDTISIRVPRDALDDTVAFWHTHGGTSNRFRFFSDTDTSLVSQLNRPFYLGDYTGFLKVFRPGDNTLSPFRAQKLGLDFNKGYAAGDRILDELDNPIRIQTSA